MKCRSLQVWLSAALCSALIAVAARVEAAGDGAGTKIVGRSLAGAPRMASPPERAASDADPRVAPLAARLSERVAALRTAAARHPSREPAAVAALRRRAGDDIEVRMRPQFGTPMQIRGRQLEAAVMGRAAGAAGDERTARAFFARHRALFRLEAPDQELVLRRQETDALSYRHLRFAQTYRQLPVWPAEITVQLDAAGSVEMLQGFSVATPKLASLDPTVTADAALASARVAVRGADGARATSPSLIIYALARGGPRLAWQLDLSVALNATWMVVVDAITGRVLSSYNRVAHENVAGSGQDLFGDTRPLNVFRDGGTFYLTDTSKPMFDRTSQPPEWDTTRGAVIVFDARNQPPTDDVQDTPDEVFYVTAASANGFDLPDGVSAAFNVSATYDYYLDRHARDSFDNQRSSIYAMVRIGRNFFNAFWWNGIIHFGDGNPYAGVLDTVAHEFTHGVTEYTANLIYKDQSGAMNEGFSDIFGEMVEARTFGDYDWLHGTGGNVTRNMARPEDYDQPSRLSDFFFTESDNGGVHTNSGILNYAFYLLAAVFEKAIGLRDAERIFYRALAFPLVSNSQFIDARLACIAAAEEIFGAGSRQARVTAEAFDAVEVYDGRGTPHPPDFPPVEGVDATLALFYDDLDGNYFLARREMSLGDPVEGVKLLDVPAGPVRPSVSGDGSFAVFVDANSDLCFVNTDGTPIDPEGDTVEECLGLDFIFSAAVSPEGGRYGFVLLDEFGDPDNRISIIDVGPGGGTRTFVLRAPAQDIGMLDGVLYAGTLEFTADGEVVVYEALNAIRLVDGTPTLAWSIYALDLQSEETLALVPPLPGYAIGLPSLSQTSDNFLTFDAFDVDAGASTIITMNLTTGLTVEIATVGGYGAPSYAGDDTAIIYSQNDEDTPTGFSLVRQRLGEDRVTPVGSPALWLTDADYGLIYRRGDFTGPPPTPTVTPRLPTPTATRTRTMRPQGPCVGDCDRNGVIVINELIRSVSIALGVTDLGQCALADRDADGQVEIAELIAAVNAALSGCATG